MFTLKQVVGVLARLILSRGVRLEKRYEGTLVLSFGTIMNCCSTVCCECVHKVHDLFI